MWTFYFGFFCVPGILTKILGSNMHMGFLKASALATKKQMCIVDTKILYIAELLVLENLIGAGERRKACGSYSWRKSREDCSDTSHNVLSQAG